ncbi:hypothetical protein GCM10010278_44200 [Streptomyces melanogenes]|nr:hypothetical protein GCM10010278_44200 [Streptomyces melanogenes]
MVGTAGTPVWMAPPRPFPKALWRAAGGCVHLRPGGGLIAQFPAPLKMPLRGNPLGAPQGRFQGRGELREQPTTVRSRTT